MDINIGYGQIDPTAKIDSAPKANDKQLWINMDDLKIDGLVPKNIQTCEHNQAILDGTQEHLPGNPENYSWGFWSLSMSGVDRIFQGVPPTLDIGFTYNHKSPGLSFLFYPHSEDWADKIRVTWYSTPPEYEYYKDQNGNMIQIEIYSGIVIKSGIYILDGVIGIVQEEIYNFKHIKVEFISTNIRNRFIKLAGIDYGFGRSFPNEIINTVTILEEIDPTSDVISINTINFQIKSDLPEYSLVSGLGETMLMQYQPLTVMGNQKEFGTFFLQFPWTDLYGNGTVIDYQGIDAIGVMDKYQFWGGIYYNILFSDIVSQLFSICFPTQLIRYEIDTIFIGKHVSGWIPTGTCRTALQLICFAIGAVADDSRRDYVWIYPRDKEINGTIEDDEIYRSPSLKPTTYYSGADVTAYEYVPSSETIEAHKSALPVGQRPIKFSEPLYDIQISAGATILSQSANHAIINVTTAGEIIITGTRYIVNQTIFSYPETKDIPAGEVENIKQYSNCTMMSSVDAPNRAKSLFEYLQQRAKFEGDMLLKEREPGYMYSVSTGYRRQNNEYIKNLPINGTIERLNVNLRGERATARVIGDVADPRNG